MDNIVENNKLIAEFMGMELMSRTREGWQPSRFNFHNSWDSLMPVVGKIESLGIGKRDYTVRISYDICRVDYTDYKMREETPIVFKRTTNQRNKIEAVYNAIAEFIQWYKKTA